MIREGFSKCAFVFSALFILLSGTVTQAGHRWSLIMDDNSFEDSLYDVIAVGVDEESLAVGQARGRPPVVRLDNTGARVWDRTYEPGTESGIFAKVIAVPNTDEAIAVGELT